MQTLFNCHVPFRKRFWDEFIPIAFILFIVGFGLLLVKVTPGTYILGTTLLGQLIVSIVATRRENTYWIQELSLLNDSNRLRIVCYKFDKRLDILEGDLSEFKFYLMYASRYSYKLKIDDSSKHSIVQFQVAEWSKKNMEYCVREIHKRGGEVKINMVLKEQKRILTEE